MSSRPRVLSIGSDTAVLETRNAVLRSAGFEVYSCLAGDRYMDRISAAPFDAVVMGDSVPPADRERIAHGIRSLAPHMPIVMMYRYGDGGEVSGQADASVGSLDSPAALVNAVWTCVRRERAASAGTH